MAVNGDYMAWRVRAKVIPYVRAFGDCVLQQVMPAFFDLEKRADEFADNAFDRFGSEPAGEDFDGDMSVFAEQAEEEGQAFDETMVALRQTRIRQYRSCCRLQLR